MTARRDLAEAHAMLVHALELWPAAQRNLHELQNGYPTPPSDQPHHCPCRGQCACPCPVCACDTKLTPVEAAALTTDPCRQAARTLETALNRLIDLCSTKVAT